MFRFPVSIKGIVEKDNKILLLKNERNEWELPGGKLEPDETTMQCVEREILEEVGLSVYARNIIDTWVYTIEKGAVVLIVTYYCHLTSDGTVVISNEHKEYGWFPYGDIPQLFMPEGYKKSIDIYVNMKKAGPFGI